MVQSRRDFFEDMPKVLNEEIHLFIHSVNNYEVPTCVLNSVLCFGRTVVSETQSLPLKILAAYRGLRASQRGKVLRGPTQGAGGGGTQQDQLTWSLRVTEGFLEEVKFNQSKRR